MTLKSPHKDWRLPLANVLDVRAVGLDQVLTRLWLRVLNDNRALMRRTGGMQTVAELVNEISRRGNSKFRGFPAAPEAAEAWLRADLVKTLKRYPERFAVARPVHGLATRVRNQRESDDSAASLAVYGWLRSADAELIDVLADFLTVDVERERIDLASYALALLGEDQEEDVPVREPEDTPRPLCRLQATTYADDLRRLLAYRTVMPRATLVDHLRRLTGLYLGLTLLRTFAIVGEVERSGGTRPACEACAAGVRPEQGRCPYPLELVVDCGEDARSPIAKLSEEVWARQEDQLARYVRSHLALKKLDEFASDQDLEHESDSLPHSTLEEIASVEASARPEVLNAYFRLRITSLIGESGADDAKDRLRELEAQYRGMGLSPFRVYVALLANFSERRWVAYHRQLVDSLLAKNSGEGLLRQPLGGRRRRRAALSPGLLETLTLIAVVGGDARGFFTRPLRVDELVARLDDRYDLLVSRPPAYLAEDASAARTLAGNVTRFKDRLRETGLFTDLSDAFLAQTVRPRFVLREMS
jgi:hypothetical protein